MARAASTEDRRPRDLAAITACEGELASAADGELTGRAAELRRRAEGGAALDDLLAECFALVRETARRALGERPYDVQMLAAVALHDGKLVEMQTGEGKTLAAVAPVALNALAGRGVHVLTFNDYLAHRDAAWMGPIYGLVGVDRRRRRPGVVGGGAASRLRLRRHLSDRQGGRFRPSCATGSCLDPADQVHRPFHLALVDEADSILIDEARIPLVIAGSVAEAQVDLGRLAALARRLEAGVDFATDEHAHNIFLTDRGARRAEELLGCGDLFAAANLRLQAELRNALHAETLLRRDVDYIVRDGRVELVDELTGRVAENRHWPDGLQAALEAKEGLLLQPEGKVLSSIAIQHFLHRYPRLCGMTATARPAAGELAEVYGLDVVTVPTHRPSIRIDRPDRIFATRDAKRRALLAEIARVHAEGRPILVGTVSVEESEGLAGDLRRAGVACRVLNAKNDAEEAAIVAEAGAPGAVTISTNMAGRGTDIRLGGADERDRERVVAQGGLYVVGTNRHASRRIDDQLRGRAGRQGDPGESRFLISLEDDLLARYGIARLVPAKLLPARAAADALDHPAIQREVARVQRIVEGEHGDVRRRLLATAKILEHQRSGLQGWRQAVLEGRDEAGLLAARSPERWSRLTAAHGPERMAAIERRLILLAIDRSWSDYLAEMQAVRDEIHLVQLGGRDPFAEFYRTAGAAWPALLDRIDDAVVETFQRLEVGPAGAVDWEGTGLRGPSSTWTYLIDDNVFGGNTFLALSNRAGIALWAVLLTWPLLLVWGLFEHWRRRRRTGTAASAEPEDEAAGPEPGTD